MMNNKFYYLVVTLHVIFNTFLWFGWISNNKLLLEVHLSALLISSLLFYLCKGCIISKLEKQLLKSDWTVVDPILKKLGITISKKNRKKLTIFLFGLSICITIYKLYV